MKTETKTEKIWEKIYTVYKIEYQGIVMYIGKTNDFYKRKWRHLNGQGAIPADVDINKIEIIPIETFNSETDALKREDELIVQYDTIKNGWNQCRSGLRWFDNEYVKEYKRNWCKQYYQEHIDECRDKNRQYQQRPERIEYQKQYREIHREERRQKAREYNQQHKEQRREYYLRKKAEKLKAQTV